MKADQTPIPDLAERDEALSEQQSFIVQAPAGSGKTTLLASRYVRLLTQVSRPEEILAITFTKKAAGEMRHRVLAMLNGDSPEADFIRQRNHSLGWQIFENPNVLKIQTIDSFALEIASQTPALDNAAGLRITEHAAQYYALAAEDLLRRMYEDHPTNALIAEFLGFLDNDADKAVRLLSYMLAKRDQWLNPVTAIATSTDHSVTMNLLADAITHLRDEATQQLEDALAQDDHHMMTQLADVLALPPHWSAVLEVLLTKSGGLRKRLTVKEGIEDTAQKRLFNQWLGTLHDRDLEPLLVGYAHLPEIPSNDGKINSTAAAEQIELLNLCCVCLALAAAELEHRFDAAGVLDFTGLLLRAKAALEDSNGPTDLALYLDYRIRHLLVDEFQDTSRAQFEFFNQLTAGWQMGDGNTFFAVGDPMQSIYRFRDADVSIFADAKVHGLDNIQLKSLILESNFRSDPAVVHWCNHVFNGMFGHAASSHLGEVMFSSAIPMVDEDCASSVECLRFAQSSEETNYLVHKIQTLLALDDNSSIAVLCRARPHVATLLDLLANMGISAQATEMELLATRPIIRDLMSLHHVLLHPNNQHFLFALLRSPMFGLTLTQLTTLAEEDNLDQALLDQQAQIPQLQRFNLAYAWAQSLLYEVPLREVLEGMWFRCGGSDAYPTSELRHVEAWLNLVDDLGGDAYDPTLLTSALRALFAETNSNARVQVMTIHKSKGLEFDHVLLPYLDRRAQSDESQLLLWRVARRGLLMGVRGDDVHRWLQYEDGQRARNEEKRLLYVACTRAKRTLVTSFSCEQDKNPGGLARWLTPIARPQTAANLPVQAATIAVDQGDLFRRRHLQRLPSHYHWSAPAYSPAPTTAEPRSNSAPDHLSARFEVALGLLLHRALAWVAEQLAVLEPNRSGAVSLAEKDLAALLAHLNHRLERWAPTYAQVKFTPAHLVAQTMAQITTTLMAPTGLWVLSPHALAQSEWPLTGIYNNAITHVVLDRSFVTQGRRWIIDFKTSMPNPEETTGSFIARETARYAQQLQKYSTICAGIDQQPLTTALYFTALGHLETVHET